MRVCMIFEGCYPYVYGGVSSWAHQYIRAMEDVEFVLWCIGARAEDRGKFKFELPKNVVEVHEIFLDDALRVKMTPGKIYLSGQEDHAMMNLLRARDTDWSVLFSMFQESGMNPVSLLMSEKYIELIETTCREDFPFVPFSEYFFNVRSMLLPELYLLTQQVPKADVYHSTATGYSGLLGSLGKWKYKKPFIVTEHGIYTREREEELLRANWVLPYFRKQWIDLFYGFSKCAYHFADKVTALFHRANDIQHELGCEKYKLSVINNGIHYERFCEIPPKPKDGWIDIGAVVRIAKIKDIKTMIYAFAELRSVISNARLHIMGDVDDPEYFEECKAVIRQLSIPDIIFTGVVNVIEYMEKIDFTILTSISEGQPLSVLESFAAGRACVTTDVGCCRELLEDRDGLGVAGLIVPPMNKDLLAEAMLNMCQNHAMREKMGRVGRERARNTFTHEMSMERYRELYHMVVPDWKE